jgi:hypothetical protein
MPSAGWPRRVWIEEATDVGCHTLECEEQIVLVTLMAEVNLEEGGVQWLRRRFQCPAQIAPHREVSLAGVVLKIRARECVDGEGTVRLLTEPLRGDHYVLCLIENLFERCQAPDDVA